MNDITDIRTDIPIPQSRQSKLDAIADQLRGMKPGTSFLWRCAFSRGDIPIRRAAKLAGKAITARRHYVNAEMVGYTVWITEDLAPQK